ncbi:MAG: HAMP domain-containing histidine kinase [Planctomycetes bacterium]|nr:HAMP domain-containing histidine kinase [Planctomycetota bacterium]
MLRASAAMIRRISTKLVLAVLGAVIVPFLGFALFVEYQMRERLSRDVVLSSLRGLANDLAAQIDREVGEYRNDIQFLAADPFCWYSIEEARLQATGRDDSTTLRKALAKTFDSAVVVKRHFELLVLVNAAGSLIACNRHDQQGAPLPVETILTLEGRNFAPEPWFAAGLEARSFALDQHTTDLLGSSPQPRWFLGFSMPVFSEADPGEVSGVLFGLVDWSKVQDEVAAPAIKEYFRGLVPDEYPSAYAWVWKSDANTILAHQNRGLYGQRVSEDLGLAALTQAALAADGGLYPPYEFGGKAKSAAFKHTRPPERHGFGWVVGVGIDDDDIFRGVNELRKNLVRATAVVLLVALLWTLVIARRITQPILSLREHTRRVAAGDLDARVEVGGGDEMAELGNAFNDMTREIKVQRSAIVKAEKDAAWREMARQVAHDIKNPLTPIQLSVELLQRAKREQSPQFDSIFERTTDTIARQVAHLREIAADFQALTGALKQQNPRDCDAGLLVDDLLSLNGAWAREASIAVVRSGGSASVFVDEPLLRRVLQNLISNAIQSMPEGGELSLDVSRRGERVSIEVKDRGVGLPEEVRAHLFEPYFTTRSGGTGLGLAIARRAVEEMGGTIRLEPRGDGAGSVATVELPAGRGAAGPESRA